MACSSSNELSKKELLIIEKWNGIVHKPKCIVFDLDLTLWPFLVDYKILPPLRRVDYENSFKVFDHNKQEVKHFEDVPIILRTLKEHCFKNGEYLCVASRATAHECALHLINLFEWTRYFDSFQIYSGTKQKHMKQIKNELNLKSFNQILFFDDSKLNLETTKSLGVIGHKVTRHYGLNVDELINGFKNYSLHFLKDQK